MTWTNNSVEPDKMTVKEFLDYLTDINWHSARVLVETIIDGRCYLIKEACEVWLQHNKAGHLTSENEQRRRETIEAMKGE